MTPKKNKHDIGFKGLLTLEWRFMLYGGLMSFWSSLGQTYFISLFSPQIRGELGLSHGDFGLYYAIATTASAVTLIWLGKLADQMSVPKLSFWTITALCLAAFYFSTIGGAITLIIGLYLLRLFGQGMMYHVFSTAVARRYRAARGRALSLTGIAINVAESVFPTLVALLLISYSWRDIWQFIPIIAFLMIAPFLTTLTQRTPYQDGLGRDGSGRTIQARNNPQEKAADDPNSHALNRRQVMRDPVFWLLIIFLIATPSFVVTGLFFHQLFIAEMRGVDILTWSSGYVFYAAGSLGGALIGGMVIDRFTAQRSAFFGHGLLALACITFLSLSGPVGLTGYFLIFGIASGMISNNNAALLAERYGTTFLGEVRALAQPVMVFASALSPMLMGWMIDIGADETALMLLGLSLAASVSSAAFIWFTVMDRSILRHG